jgi:hypothetical protein
MLQFFLDLRAKISSVTEGEIRYIYIDLEGVL